MCYYSNIKVQNEESHCFSRTKGPPERITAMNKRISRRIAALVLALCMLFAFSAHAFATAAEPVLLSKEEGDALAEKYKDYFLDFSRNPELDVMKVLENAEIKRTEIRDKVTYGYYDNSVLTPFVGAGSVVQNIEFDGTTLRVGFASEKNVGAILSYVNGELVERTVVDWNDDKTYSFVYGSDPKVYDITDATDPFDAEKARRVELYFIGAVIVVVAVIVGRREKKERKNSFDL